MDMIYNIILFIEIVTLCWDLLSNYAHILFLRDVVSEKLNWNFVLAIAGIV